jgi:N-acetylmuramoyl-L-alanine amidase
MYRMPNCHTSANCRHLGVKQLGACALAVLMLVFAGFLAPKISHAAQEMAPPVMPPVIIESFVADGGALTLTFDQPVALKIVHLDGPPRIVIDLPETNFANLEQGVRLPGLISDIRYGLMAPGLSRIVLTLSLPAIATPAIATSESAGGTNNVHNIGLAPVDPQAFAARAREDAALQNPVATTKADRLGEPATPAGQRPFTVVIDPGHGGIDGGAEGRLGTREKDITLAFGLAIRDALKDIPQVQVIMTRQTDVFVGLHERVKIARQNNAELFLSVHGDSIKLPEVRGATLYTLSDSASDAISSALANQENLSDSIAGLPPMQPDADMNSILVDLLKQETATFSRELATQIIVHLKENSVELINNPVRSAGFSVLTAPDVPSLLLEMGYLSNHEDELLMRDPEWRKRTAEIVAKAIATHAKGHRTQNVQP